MKNNPTFHWTHVMLSVVGWVLILSLSACAGEPTPLQLSPTQPQLSPVSTIAPTQVPTLVPSVTPTLAPTSAPTNSPFLSGFPDPAAFVWTRVVSGLDLPVDIQNAGDGTGRLFIVQKRGSILILQNNQLQSQPFLDISGEVDSSGIEQGLLGLAFHPHYAQNGMFFVYYIDQNGNSVVARFHVAANDPNRADPASEVDLFHINQPFPNHNGGGLAFGPDGYLYIGSGDGGSERDPNRTGQNLQTQLGKLLRINIDSGDTATIPPDNPFIGKGGLPEIWAYGLRNPWRFSFDRLTGNLFIADVGQDAWEEVDFVPAGTPGGMNFGWSYYEGMHPYQDQPPANATFTWPVTEYSHAFGCAVTGGYVYRGMALPEWQGIYFYGDYCSGNVWGLIETSQDKWQSKILFTTGAKITTFGEDEAGELYISDYGTGTILRLTRR
ncbi:MAG: PQQ-dependent sugar dehydrogenase [Anaerolineales bacterium]